MSAYSVEAAKFNSEPVALFELTIGSLTKRWSNLDRDIAGAGFYEGRIISGAFGTIDRKFTVGGSGAGDLTIEVANTDDDLNTLLTSFTDANLNIIRGTATVKLGFTAIDYADYETQAVYQYAELVKQSGRSVTLRFTDQDDNLFGILRAPLDTVVMAQLETTFASDFPGSSLIPGSEDQQVQIAFGHWIIGHYPPHLDDGLIATPSHQQRLTNPIVPWKEAVYLVAVSPHPFDMDRNDAKLIWEAWGAGGKGSILLAHETGGNSPSVRVDSYDLSATLGYHVLVIRSQLGEKDESAEGISGASRNALRIGAMPIVSLVVRAPRPKELIADMVATFSSKSSNPWISDNVDLASFTTMDEHTAQMKCRARISREINGVEFVGKVAEYFLADVFFKRDGKIAVHTLNIEGGPNPAYTTAMELTESDVLIGKASASRSEEGRHELVNRVIVKTGWPEHGHGDEKMIVTINRPASESDHDRWVTREIESHVIYDMDTARLIGEEILYRNSNPRPVITVPLPLSAADRELGDIVKLVTTEIAGFSAGKYCIVEGYRIDLDNLKVYMDVVDFDALLRSKPYILDSEANWIVATSGSVMLDVNAASATIGASGAIFQNVLPNDILQIGGWPGGYRTGAGKNNLNCVVLTKDSDIQLTLRSGGGEDGSIPSETEVVEFGGWRIVRGQDNRNTAGGSYSIRATKYGVLAVEADGFFRDDREAGFTHGEG